MRPASIENNEEQAMPMSRLRVAIVVLLFGVGKIPQLGKGLGEGIKNFKDAMKDGHRENPGDDSTKTPK